MGVPGLTALARAAAKEYTIGSAIRKEQCGLPLLRKRKRGRKRRLTALLELLCLSRMRRAAGNRLLCGQPELSVNCFPPNWLDRCSDTKKQEKGCGEIRILF